MMFFGHLPNHHKIAILLHSWYFGGSDVPSTVRKRHEKIYQSLFSLLKLPNIYIQQNDEQQKTYETHAKNNTDFCKIEDPLTHKRS